MEQFTHFSLQNYYMLFVIFGSALFLYFFFHKNGKWNFLENSFNLSALKVQLASEPEALSDETPKMEMVFSQLLDANGKFWRGVERAARGRGWRRMFKFGKKPYIGVEVSVIDRAPSVYFLVPNYAGDELARIINLQFPNAKISKVDDYTIFQGESEVTAKSLKFQKDDLLMLNTSAEFPLVKSFEILKKFSAKDSFGFQILLQPYPESWHAQMKNAFLRERDKAKIEFREENEKKQKKLVSLNNKLRKVDKQCVAANMRVVFSSYSKDLVKKFDEDLKQVFNKNHQEAATSNELKIEDSDVKQGVFDYSFRKFDDEGKVTLNVSELAWIIQLF